MENKTCSIPNYQEISDFLILFRCLFRSRRVCFLLFVPVCRAGFLSTVRSILDTGTTGIESAFCQSKPTESFGTLFL